MATSQQQGCQAALEQGEFALDLRQHAEAEQLFRKALESTHTMEPHEIGELRAVALLNLSRAQERQDRAQEALETCTQAAAHVAELKHPEYILGVQDQMANLLIQLGHYQRAIPFCENSIRLAAQRQNTVAVADRLWRAGKCYVRNGLHDYAVSPLREALDVFRTRSGDPRTPVVLVDLGNALRRKHPSNAEACYKEAAEIWERQGRLESATPAWVNIGLICSQQDRQTEALAYYEKALRVREASPDTPPSRMGTLLNNIANCQRRMRRFEEATRSVDRAIELLQTEGGGTLALAYGSRALIFRDEGNNPAAAEWFTKARQEHEKQPSPNLADLVEVLENEEAALGRIGKTHEAKITRERLESLRGAMSEIPPVERPRALTVPTARNVGEEGAVLIELDGTTLPDAVYRQYDLAALEDQLSKAVEPQGLGEYDGNEFGPQNTTLFLYGADAEALFVAIEPILRTYPLCQNARVTIRKGRAGSTEREIVLPQLA